MKKVTGLADRIATFAGGSTESYRRPNKRNATHGKPSLAVELLEDRFVLSGMNCGCDPAVMALVPDSAVTNTAIKSGAWSDPSTWANGKTPGAGANVLISQGVDVTLNQVVSAPIHTIRVDGELDFAPHANTGLSVDTLVVNDDAILNIGTANTPIDATHQATITFTDSGPINTQWDPTLLSRGLISMGTVNMFGAAKTAYQSLAVNPTKGATTLTLSQVPTGWSVGDRLIVTATTVDRSSSQNQNDDVRIQSINGNQVTLTSALLYDHVPPQQGLAVYVTDVTRNIVLQSQNASNISRHGHVMFMTDSVNLNYVAFDDLGRTDKTLPVNDPQLNAQGQLIAGTGTNPRARYAVHFHEVGTDAMQTPAYVNGCAVVDSPGWGYVNHDSYVNFVNDVAYNVVGAAFVTESGAEIGSFQNDLAIRDMGDGTGTWGIESRMNVQDFGHGGEGFWLQGFGVAVNNCIAVDAADTGFEYYGRGLIQNGVTTQFSAANLTNPAWANGQSMVDVRSVPILSFTGNTAYGVNDGVGVEYMLTRALSSAERGVIDHLTVWNANDQGVRILYTSQLTMQNSTILGNGHSNLGVTEGNEGLTSDQYVNLTVEGWKIGLGVSEQGTHTISGGYFNNIINVSVPLAFSAGRVVTMSGIHFASPGASVLAGQTHYDVYLQDNYRLIDPYGSSAYFASGSVTLNGVQLYTAEQAGNYVPFPKGTSNPSIPAPFLGLTNQQLWDRYGLALGGAVAPSTAKSVPGIHGLEGSASVFQPAPHMISAQQATHTQPYKLVYKDSKGQVVSVSTRFTLHLGWNVLTITIAGKPFSFLVWGV